MRRLPLAACALILAAPAGPAAALELRAGVLRQDFASLWAAGPRHERAWALNAELGFDPWTRVLGGEIAPFVGGTLAAGNALDRAYAGLGWELSGERAYLRLGLGAAVHDGETDDPGSYGRRRQMGGRVLFHVPLEVGWRLTGRLSAGLYFDHVSNGTLGSPNPGLDSAGLRLGWRF